MCAIIDANVVGEVFGSNRSPAGKQFFDWVNTGRGRLMTGGKLTSELDKGSAKFRLWAAQALRSGLLITVNDEEVDDRANKLQQGQACKSDDPHIIALAQVGGARLLYSNDKDLHKDFRDKNLIDDPRGNVYSTIQGGEVRRAHRDLLGKRNLCLVT